MADFVTKREAKKTFGKGLTFPKKCGIIYKSPRESGGQARRKTTQVRRKRGVQGARGITGVREACDLLSEEESGRRSRELEERTEALIEKNREID